MKYAYLITYLLNIIIIFLILFRIIDLNEYDELIIDNFFNQNKTITITILFLIYITVIILNLPLTALITTYSGALLGVYETIIYVFFASSLGCYLSLLVNRYFLRNQNLLNKIIKFELPQPSIILIFLLKAFPVLPFTWIIIYTSATDFSAKKFLLACSVGCLTTIILFANLGNAIVNNNFFNLLIISLLFFILFIIGYFLKNYFLKK
jgi:uncharacterized membrane protein YdjX (TVP38/TMEM64 family)